MTNLAVALAYAAAGLAVFPVAPTGRKRPLCAHGWHAATTDADTIRAWWGRFPDALPATPTGAAAGRIVLDIDVKDGVSGWDALDEMGALPLPDTPMVHTPSGGLHVHFRHPGGWAKTVAGKLGRGLDTRGDGGSIILPDGNSRRWDPHQNPDRVPLAPCPPWLAEWFRREEERSAAPVTPLRRPANDATDMNRYGAAALDDAARRIMGAPAGEQEATLNGEAFGIGTLVGAGELPREFAERVLVWAGCQMVSCRRGDPWLPGDVSKKVKAALDAGARRPRVGVRHG